MTVGFVVGGVASGVGKTSVTLGLLEAFGRRGLAVQAFKVGPDFIDPGFHRLVTGRPSYNLDGWMCGRAGAGATFARAAAGADLAVVEGVMGCFDGAGGGSEHGSTAEIAKWLGLPVVLVVDASAQSRSAAAATLGFERFDPDLDMAAVIVNRVGGEAHAREVGDAIRASCRAAPLGAIRWDDALRLPERHLGLVTAVEGTLGAEGIRRLGDAVGRSLDLDRLLALAKPPQVPAAPEPPVRSREATPRVAIGVARDAAFQFYYEENLERLCAAGARLVAWSPLADEDVPEVDGLYLGGGYPELHAARLAANASLHKAIRRFAEAGKPIYAECGGLMFLAEALEDDDGVSHPMVGLLPARVRMRPRRMALGYAEVCLTREGPLGPSGTVARGHEFHVSTLDPVPASIARVYRVTSASGEERAEGYAVGRALLSYVHLHFGSNPGLAAGIVEACAAARR